LRSEGGSCDERRSGAFTLRFSLIGTHTGSEKTLMNSVENASSRNPAPLEWTAL